MKIALVKDGAVAELRDILSPSEIAARATAAGETARQDLQDQIDGLIASLDDVEIDGLIASLDDVEIDAEVATATALTFAAPEGFERVDIPDGAEWTAGGQWDGKSYTAPPPPPRDIAAEVTAHALALKVGVVNATRVDGLTDPVTPEGLALIERRYQNLGASINAEIALHTSGNGDPVPAGRINTLKLINAGFLFWQGVDVASEAILAAGDAADPIAEDARWPQIPAE